MRSYELSADVGGTFTDLVLRTDQGALEFFKSPTTPANIADGILSGIAWIAERLGVERSEFLAQCKSFACGTTVATNAILEGKTARTGLICTEGFRDILLIREGGKANSYDMRFDYPRPYIPRHLTFGIRERIDAEGGVAIPFDEASALQAIRRLKALEVEAAVVALLWSVVNPQHEIRVGELIERELPGIPYSLSHQVSPILREYRRTSAAAIDASLKPLVQRAISEIDTRLKAAGFRGVLTFITSNGGRAAPQDVRERPILLCLSGPSAGPQAGCRLAYADGVGTGNILTTDMGGTSFEVSVSLNWQTPLHREARIGTHSVGIPCVDVKTVGAGGGSIARVDAGGFLHVGPQSAGSAPGPACYGRGGTQPTVADANLVRGLLSPQGFADGRLRLDVTAATQAITEHVAKPLNVGVQEAAALVCMAAEQNMVSAIQDITIRRGIDPREFVLVSGGAAGGLHVASIAQEMGIPQVLIPRAAGVLSAFGIITGQVKMGYARTVFTSSDAFDHAAVNDALAAMAAEGTAFLDRMNVESGQREFGWSVEARYAGQVWQLTLPLVSGRIEPANLPSIIESFHLLHEKVYAVRSPHDQIEFIEWNLEAIGRVSSELAAPMSPAGDDPSHALLTTRSVYFRDGMRDVAVYDGGKLRAGNVIEGPSLVQEAVTTNLVPPGMVACVTGRGGLLISTAVPAKKVLNNKCPAPVVP